MAKKFDPMNEIKGTVESKAKGALKTAMKGVLVHLAGIFIHYLPIIIAVVMAGTIIFDLVNYAKEFIQGIFTHDAIMEALETEDISSLVEIKGNSEEGYYWGFVSDIDTRLDAVVKKLSKNVNTVTIKDKALLKKMIKAEIVTQYPDLGGKTFSTGSTYSGSSEERAKQMLEDMSLDEKISQMLFLITNNGNDLNKNAGGYILSDGFDFSNVKSTIENASNTVKPVIATEEEGGNVQRALSGYPDARSYGENKDYSKLEEDFTNKSKELLDKGINMNLAPVADVSKDDSYVGRRSFSDDYEVATECVKRSVRSMKSAGLMTTLKHYPGYADATSDNYTDKRSIDEIQQDVNVFKEGINEGVSTITVSHFKVDALDSENPASMSKDVINSIRNLGFDGVIMTDSMNMSAVNSIDNKYVKAIQAGNDVLEVTDFDGAKQEILDAVSRDEISVEQINESVTRILTMKFEYGVIETDKDDEENPDEVEIQETENNFQGAIHLRRVMPDKELAELKNVSTGVPVAKYKYVNTDNIGLGTKESIPDSIKEKMEGKSMNGLYGTTYDDLSYLTVPYYNLEGEIKLGHLIVNKDLEDEVLLIFQELYKSKVKINRIDIVDDLSSSVDSIDLGADKDNISYAMKLDRASKYYNNTSGFNDRAGYDGEESAHAKGNAIDINPLVNPYVSEGVCYPTNAEKYTDRNNSKLSEEEKNQMITTESEVYKIFQKYGWTWGGESDGSKDYSHFEKKEIKEIIKITNTQVETGNSSSGESGATDGDNSGNSDETAGDGKQYIVALAAGHNNANDTGAVGVTQDGTVLKEEDLTIKVAEFAEQMLSKYTNIKVVQTGSTSDNRGTVQVSDRIRLAQEANADLCIQIHLNSTEEGESSGTSNYTTTIHKSGDSESAKLSDCVLSALSSAMGIEAGVPLVDGENYDRNLSIIANSSDCGFPNIVTEGAFINNPENQQLLSNDEGLKKYAQGIVDGILQYLDVANTGYGETGTSNTTGATEVNSGIRSKIFDLKYIPLDEFRDKISNNNQEVIKEFTIDENGKILIATWSYSNTNGNLKLSEKFFNTASSYTQKYTMPLEYLIAFYIDTRNKEFVSDLAELAMDSEFVLAVQDNVTTTQTEVRETVDHDTITYPGNGGKVTYESWSEGERLVSSNLTESVSTSVELTYGDTWFMEFYKDINYSSGNLSNIIAENAGTEVGDQGTYLGDFYLTAYCKWCNSPPGSLETSSGNSAQPNRTIAVHSEYFNGEAKNGALSNGSKVVINGQVYTVEDTGDYSRSRPDDWVDIFIDGGDTQPSSSSNDPCNTAAFSGSTVPVYVAENVRPVSESGSVNEVANAKRVNTTAIIQGNVTIQDYDTVATSTSTSVLYDTDRTKYVTTTTKTDVTSVESYAYKYETGQMHVVGNEQKFITIYNKNNEFKSALKPTWLYQVLAKQERTSTMIDLTKYLIYRANGQTQAYDDITSFDFSQYAPQDFQSVGGIYGGTLQEKVWFALRSAGFSEYATAGVMGNIEAESSFNAGTVEQGSGIGIGICQWSYGRRTQLELYAASKGVDWSDENTQIEFLLGEITQGGGADGFASYALVTYNGYSPGDWINAQSVETATQAFCWTFERPGVPRMDVRIEAANKYYNEFKGRTAPTGDGRIGTIKLSGDNASRMYNMLLEAIRIADDDRYTYSQANRYGEFQYDCSSFIQRLYQQFFGIEMPSTTFDYVNYSQFLIGYPDSVELQPGDVLYKDEHVEMYLGNGYRVGAHTDGVPGPDQISVKEYNPGYFTQVYRFIQ